MQHTPQKAFISLHLFLTLFMMGVAGVALVRFAPVYMEYYHVRESLQSLTVFM